MLKPIPLDWEKIDNYHQRSKTIGGWLFKTFESISHFTEDRGVVEDYDWRVSVTFIPDANHEWILEEVK